MIENHWPDLVGMAALPPVSGPGRTGTCSLSQRLRTVVESDDDTVGVLSEPGSPRPARGSDSDAVMVDVEPVQLKKKKKNRAASLATGAREAPEVEPSVVAPSGAALYIRAVSGVRDAAGAAHGGDAVDDAVDDAVMEDASEGVPCSLESSESSIDSLSLSSGTPHP